MRVSTCWPMHVVLQCWSHARPIKGLFNCRTRLYYVPDQIIMNHVAREMNSRVGIENANMQYIVYMLVCRLFHPYYISTIYVYQHKY